MSDLSGLKRTGLTHGSPRSSTSGDCGGEWLYLAEPMELTSCDIVCSRCELHTSIDGEFLGFCGCGDPEGVARWIVEVLEAFEKRSEENNRMAFSGVSVGGEESRAAWSRNTRRIDELLGADENLRLFALYQLDHLGLLEHGTSIEGSWLTELGRKVLAALRGKPWWSE